VSTGGLCGGASDDSVCPVNPADVCCSNACIPGDCCDDAFCKTKLVAPTAICSGYRCTTCAAVTGTDYFVDPINGNDATGTGSQTLGDGGPSAGCAFKTLTRALEVIPGLPAPGSRIIVLGPSTVGSSERFPIALRSNLVLTTQGGAVTIDVPSQRIGFYLIGLRSGIQGGAGAPLTIRGQGPTDGTGVRATGTDDSTLLENLSIRGFHTGIEVTRRLTIGQGVSSSSNSIGLAVATSVAHATINVPAGKTTTSFSANATDGIYVAAGAAIALTGVPGATVGTGTVVTNGNQMGLEIVQLSTAPPPPSVIDGLVSFENGASGLHFSAGTRVKVRNSVSLGNFDQGVLVSTAILAAARLNDLSGIDLGSTTTLGDGGIDYGHNTFQAVSGSSPNVNSGICVSLDPGSGTLSAAGNTFAGPLDCTAASPGPVGYSGPGTCGSRQDLGLLVNLYLDGGWVDAAAYDAGPGGYAGVNVDLSNCTR
jgi:hypothetical protein